MKPKGVKSRFEDNANIHAEKMHPCPPTPIALMVPAPGGLKVMSVKLLKMSMAPIGTRKELVRTP